MDNETRNWIEGFENDEEDESDDIVAIAAPGRLHHHETPVDEEPGVK